MKVIKKEVAIMRAMLRDLITAHAEAAVKWEEERDNLRVQVESTQGLLRDLIHASKAERERMQEERAALRLQATDLHTQIHALKSANATVAEWGKDMETRWRRELEVAATLHEELRQLRARDDEVDVRLERAAR